jgi:hypothetical protein
LDHLPNPADPIFRDAIDQASESDRNWFKLNPSRLFRLRDVMPYECIDRMKPPSDGKRWQTLVGRIGPGMRFRAVLSIPAELDIDDTDDQQLESIFMRGVPKPFRKKLKAMLRKNQVVIRKALH